MDPSQEIETIEESDIIPIDIYRAQKAEEHDKQDLLLRLGIKQDFFGLGMVAIGIFIAYVAGGLDIASGSLIAFGVYAIKTKHRIINLD